LKISFIIKQKSTILRVNIWIYAKILFYFFFIIIFTYNIEFYWFVLLFLGVCLYDFISKTKLIFPYVDILNETLTKNLVNHTISYWWFNLFVFQKMGFFCRSKERYARKLTSVWNFIKNFFVLNKLSIFWQLKSKLSSPSLTSRKIIIMSRILLENLFFKIKFIAFVKNGSTFHQRIILVSFSRLNICCVNRLFK